MYEKLTGPKSERGFVDFLINTRGKKRTEANTELRSAIHKDILESNEPPNKLAAYVQPEIRAKEKPLSLYAVQRTFFQEFVTAPPLDIEFESAGDFRKLERINIVRLMNLLAEQTLEGRWNPAANDAAHKVANRMYLSGSLRAWVPMLKDVIAQVLRLYDF